MNTFESHNSTKLKDGQNASPYQRKEWNEKALLVLFPDQELIVAIIALLVTFGCLSWIEQLKGLIRDLKKT